MRSRIGLMMMGAVAVAATGLAGCGESTDPGEEDGQLTEEVVISGEVQNNTGGAIPANARVLIAWAVSSGPSDYSYVFGEGSIDTGAETFEVVLNAAPPTAALNAGALGVGIIAVTTSTTVGMGDDLGDVPEAQIIGAAGRYGVIYVADHATAPSIRGWAADFDAGYGVGVGGPEEDGFETFVPDDPSTVVLTIDDLDNITFVNWT